MKTLKAIKIIVLASLRDQFRSKLSVLIYLLTPIAYTSVFLIQTNLFYEINQTPFEDLSKYQFFACLFINQIIVFLTFDQNIKYLAQSVVTSDLDMLLLRPVNLFVFKYFKHTPISLPIMQVLFITGLVISLLTIDASLFLVLKIVLFIILSAVISNNTLGVVYGLVFLFRNHDVLSRVKESLYSFTQLKPPEIYPAFLKSFFIYIVPFLIFNGFMFDLIRERDNNFFWFIMVAWSYFTWLANSIVWKLGLKNYESIG